MLLFFPPKENIKPAKMIVFNCHKTFALGPACRPSCFEFLFPSKPTSIPYVIENLKPLLSNCLHTTHQSWNSAWNRAKKEKKVSLVHLKIVL